MRKFPRRTGRRLLPLALVAFVVLLGLLAPVPSLLATWTNGKLLQVLLTVCSGGFAVAAAAVAAKMAPRPDVAPPIAPAPAVPRRLPQLEKPFLGREEQLKKLRTLLDGQSAEEPGPAPSARARTILIHGQPGVGKRWLARAFALGLEAEHPDGSLYVDLATASVPRGSGEILGSLLLDLGQQPEPSTEQRISQFLTATSRQRLLILLENAADVDQIKNLLPNHSGCTVVITSQRSLGGSFSQRSLRLRLPDSSQATRMFYAHASLTANTAPLEIAEIVEQCGRLPSALQACGELVAGSASTLADLPARLDPAHLRLRTLSGPDGAIELEMRQVYDRLGDREQSALRHLALVESTTFLPWVLSPLLDLKYDDAVSVMRRLAEVELVQRVSADEVLGINRYRLHVLTRSFARAELDTCEPVPVQDAARQRLDSAFLGLTGRILARLYPARSAELEQAGGSWPTAVPDLSRLIGRLADHPDYWVRAEYGNLVRGVEIAYYEKNWVLCWRIAARLGGCVPLYVPLDVCREAFAKARQAAKADGSDVGGILVCLAHAEFLVAVEDHSSALRVLREANALIHGYEPASADEPTKQSLLAARLRTEGEMWLQAASYLRANEMLSKAAAAAKVSGDRTEEQRIDVLAAEAAAALEREQWLAEPRYQNPALFDDRAVFRAKLARAEWARRQMQWAMAHSELEAARGVNHGDARRRAAVEYRFAKLELSQCRASDGTARAEHGAAALVHAATAWFRFSRMGNRVGAIRAQCMVILALTELDAFEEAKQLCATAREGLAALTRSRAAPETMLLLHARVDRAEGLLEYRQSDEADSNARSLLEQACRAFLAVGDWWSAAECQLHLGQVLRRLGKWTSANASLWPACDAFEKCGDVFNLELVDAELASADLANARLTRQ